MDKNDTANADTTMALMQYIILKAAPRRLHSNIKYILIYIVLYLFSIKVTKCYLVLDMLLLNYK
jgi:hypothetical protein